MKVVILAGGLPSKLIEEDEKIPKPMAEIGGRPILWHIMKQYAHYGYNDFIICGGYKVDMIKQYFMNYYIYQSDITIDLQSNDITVHRKKTEDWKVTVVDTGFASSIPQRLAMIHEYIDGESFIVSYGDCVSDINVRDLVHFHNNHHQVATIAVARPIGRNEIMPIVEEKFSCEGFDAGNAWVNACNMVFTREIFDYLDKNMLSDNQMISSFLEANVAIPYIHQGFWSPMETVRDKTYLQTLWDEKKAPWKVWND